jgi:alpha-beta hydrolase superfamily lysophospholipase
MDAPHGPLLLIAGEKDEIIPAHLTENNAKAYKDPDSVTAFKAFEGRSHYICGEPGWEEVAQYAADWLGQQGIPETVTVSGQRLAGTRP